MTGVADPVKQVGRNCQEIGCDTPWTEWRWKRDRQADKKREENTKRKGYFYWMHVTWQETITKQRCVCNPHKSIFIWSNWLRVPEPLNKSVTCKHATRSVWEGSMIVVMIMQNFNGHFNAKTSLPLWSVWLGLTVQTEIWKHPFYTLQSFR